MILKGEFCAGQHLREVQLAEMFGVSRTPVRLALAANERHGLLEYGPNRGYVVRSFLAKDIASAFEIRALVEGYSARRAAEKGLSPEEERQMIEAIDSVSHLLGQEEILNESDHETWRNQNALYHRIISDKSGNRFVGPVLQSVQQIPSVYPPVLTSYAPEKLRTYNDQHLRILECILRRESVRAEFLMREHILSAGDEILDSIKSSIGGSSAPPRV